MLAPVLPGQVWRSEEGEKYDKFVKTQSTATPPTLRTAHVEEWPHRHIYYRPRYCARRSTARAQAVLFGLGQVASAGPLGVLGRNGWFCLESDVAKWPALAGWRGLLDPVVRAHFNDTFWAYGTAGFDDGDWGPNEQLMQLQGETGEGIGYDVVFMGAAAETVITARLEAGLSPLSSCIEAKAPRRSVALQRCSADLTDIVVGRSPELIFPLVPARAAEALRARSHTAADVPTEEVRRRAVRLPG
jgi:hypothetical protein